jgi:hypothetical protein
LEALAVCELDAHLRIDEAEGRAGFLCEAGLPGQRRVEVYMSETTDKTVERLEKLAAWQRINAEHAGASWIWEARVRTAEDLERRAANIRGVRRGFSSKSILPPTMTDRVGAR